MNAHIRSGGLDRRTLLKLAGLSATAGVLAGCGGNDPGGAATGGDGEATDSSVSLLLFGGGDEIDGFINDELAPGLASSTGTEVELQKSDWGSGFQKIVTAAASGTLPDVMLIGGIWTAPLASKNALMPLDDLIASWGELESFYPGMVEDGTFEGTSYALPLYSDTRTALYRVDLLEQAGVDRDALPTTWEEFRAVAEQVQGAGIDGLISAVSWGQDGSIGLQQSFAQLMLQAGGTYYDDEGRAQFSSPEGVEALRYMTAFYSAGLADVNMVDQGAGANPFVAGQAAMTFGSNTMFNDARNNAPDVVDSMVAGIPLTGPAGEPVTSAWINKIGIAANTSNPDGAWELVQELLSRDSIEQVLGIYGGLPTRSDLADTEYVRGIDPGFITAAEYIVPQPPHPNMLTIAPAINTYLEEAIRNPDDVERILGDLDAKIDEINGF